MTDENGSPSGGGPSLSVIVAAWNSPTLLRGCLESLAASETASVEILVAYPRGRGFEEAIEAFPRVKAIEMDEAATVPRLRKAGLEYAAGGVIAFLEDHATVAPGWSVALLAAYRDPSRQAVGGPVAQGNAMSAMDWGAYLFDYGRFMPPQRGGEASSLSGLNMSFRRDLLQSLSDETDEGVFEGPIHDALARRGVSLFLAPDATVYQHRRYSLRESLVFVHYLGRGYAARRLRNAGSIARWARAVGSCLLPPVLLWRTLSVVFPKRRDTGFALASVWYLALITLAWSGGECLGYIAGPGDGDARWR
jgi:glycosyltransferase involved in cell wall biosynthesis